jgi:hypothetical protein
MFVKLLGAETGHIYYVNTNWISCINFEGGKWSYSINDNRVSLTAEAAKKLLKQVDCKFPEE